MSLGVRLSIFLVLMTFVAVDLISAANAASLSRQRQMGIQVGNASSLTICSGYSCARKPRLRLTKKQLRYIDRSMRRVKSAKQERKAIAQLIAWKERVAQRTLGMPRDNAKATGFCAALKSLPEKGAAGPLFSYVPPLTYGSLFLGYGGSRRKLLRGLCSLSSEKISF